MQTALLLLKFAPAFAYIGAGVIAKRYFSLSQAKVAQLLFYVFVPLVVFKGALLSDTASFFLYIALSFGISLAMGLLAGCYRKWFGAQLNVGVLRCTFSYFNIGWFGIPIVYALYGEAAAIVMTGLYVGGMLFGNTVGFLWVTDGHGSGGVLKKLSKIPALYAMALGFALHFSPILPVLSSQAWLMQGLAFGTVATSVLGMGLVGMSVADVSHRAVAWRNVAALLGLRLLTGVVLVGLVALTVHYSGLLQPLAIEVLCLLPILPIAANLLVFTTQTKSDGTFVGVILLASTVLSCVLFAVLQLVGGV